MSLLSLLTRRRSDRKRNEYGRGSSVLPNGAVVSSLYANKKEDLYLYHLSQDYSSFSLLLKNPENAGHIRQEITSDILVSMFHTLKQECPQLLERHALSPLFSGMMLINPTALIPLENETKDGKPNHGDVASGWSASLLAYETDTDKNNIIDFMSEIEVSYRTSFMLISEYKESRNLGQSDRRLKIFAEWIERNLSDYIFWEDLNPWE
jgi:hypothetical protein